MRVVGIEVKDSAVAALALRLHQAGDIALAIHVGRAVDKVEDELTLDVRERESVLRALDDCPESLADLRDVLLQQVTSSKREGIG